MKKCRIAAPYIIIVVIVIVIVVVIVIVIVVVIVSKAFRCDCLDTPTNLYLKQRKFLQKIGPWKFRDWAHIAPFGPLGTLKGPETRSKCVATICLTP